MPHVGDSTEGPVQGCTPSTGDGFAFCRWTTTSCTWLSRSQRGRARVDVSPERMATFRYQAICFAIHHGVVRAASSLRRGIVFLQLPIVCTAPGEPGDFCKSLCMDRAMPFPSGELWVVPASLSGCCCCSWSAQPAQQGYMGRVCRLLYGV